MAIKMELEFSKKSMRQLEERMMEVDAGVHEVAAAKVLLSEAEDIMELSGRWVPEKTGALKASRFVTEVTFDDEARLSEITMGYGGVADTVNPETGEMASSYALKVHEDLETPRAAGKRAKFLELPLLILKRRYFVRLTKGVEEFFGTVGGK